jgi:23S rRNA (uracil1939-C5)-methyltransferase
VTEERPRDARSGPGRPRKAEAERAAGGAGPDTGGEEPLEVTVRALAVGGSGVADLPDGRVVFVPRTAPGDQARIRIEKSKRRWAVGALERVMEPGPHRVQAPCPLYARCGGCQLQHLPYERQIEWKGRFVADALERIGGFERMEPPEVVPSPRRLHYRSRITFTLRRLRGGRVVAGFHALGRPAHVVDVHGECLLPHEPIVEAWVALRAGWGSGAGLLPAGGRLRLTLRDSGGPDASGGGSPVITLLVEGGAAQWNVAPLLEAVPALAAVWHRPGDGDGPIRLVASRAHLAAGPAFEQVNPEAAEAMRAWVLEQASGGVNAAAAGRAVDAFCGVGVYGRALAERGWSVLGIELERWAVGEAAADAPDGFEIVQGRVEEHLADALPADLLIVNPPRVGLSDEITEAIRARVPHRLVYVSCDPATLARDLGALRDDYAIEAIRAFDLFPQTAHVETVVSLRAREVAA